MEESWRNAKSSKELLDILTKTSASLQEELDSLKREILHPEKINNLKSQISSLFTTEEKETKNNEIKEESAPLTENQKELIVHEKIEIKPKSKQEKEKNTEKEEKLLFECKSKFVNILEEARNLLQLEYYSSTELNPAKFDAEEKFKYLFLFNEKEEFQFPGKLHITNVSGSFVSFIFNYLSDFFYKNNENGLQDVDVQSVGLLFDLWMSVIPLFHAQMIQVPRIAALFYCDTIVLAHFITVLPLLFPFHRLEMPPIFLEYILSFKKLGVTQFNFHVETQITQILDIIKRMGGLSKSHRTEKQEILFNAFDQIKHEISQLAVSWKEVLLEPVYLQTLGEIVQRIAWELIILVEKENDFGEEETKQLRKLFCSLLDIEKYFVDGKNKNVIDEYVPVWQKYKIVCTLFDMSMVGIVSMWEKGELNAFTKEEVRHWLTSLFSDSSFRDKNLSKIK